MYHKNAIRIICDINERITKLLLNWVLKYASTIVGTHKKDLREQLTLKWAKNEQIYEFVLVCR